jgi:hypothetical protein
MLKDRGRDLFEPVLWPRADLLREALLIADDNSYHLGLTVVRRMVEIERGRRHPSPR